VGGVKIRQNKVFKRNKKNAPKGRKKEEGPELEKFGGEKKKNAKPLTDRDKNPIECGSAKKKRNNHKEKKPNYRKQNCEIATTMEE